MLQPQLVPLPLLYGLGALSLFLFVDLAIVVAADRFNYNQTNWIARDFAPHDWDRVRCDTVEDCPGWPTNWKEINPFIPYESTANACRDCSKSSTGICLRHQQSPIDLPISSTLQLATCLDRHRMRYWAGECNFRDMKFEILPHVLRAYQPDFQCAGATQPQLDYSKGFPAPWKLSFTDISVPSHHTIDGVVFDAEIVLTHTYGSVHDLDRLIGNVSIMLRQGGRADHYDFLELYLRAWAKTARAIYSRCFRPRIAQELASALHAALENDDDNDDDDNDDDDNDDNEYEYRLHDPRFQTDPSRPKMLWLSYYNRAWHPYDWYVRANTEFYFRYEGSMPEPPCIEGVHWRVLSSPIRVSPRQIRVLHYLLQHRIDPDTCQAHTAAALVVQPNNEDKVKANRPIQTTTRRHRLVYCDCSTWIPKGAKDKATCQK